MSLRPLSLACSLVLSSLAIASDASAQSRLLSARPAEVSGTVTHRTGGAAVAGARVTVFTPGLGFFRETRTGAEGGYALAGIPAGTYRLGVAFPGLAYEERALSIGGGASPGTLAPGAVEHDFQLRLEEEIGSWETVGDTLPNPHTEFVALRPDGLLFYCESTSSPLLFDPRTGARTGVPQGFPDQGCMNTTLLADGSLLFVGGAAFPLAHEYSVPWVKALDRSSAWNYPGPLGQSVGRFYPGLARLNDGRLLVMGGGTSPDGVRSATCELFDPQTRTWLDTADMGSPSQYAPSVLLYTGDVLRSWSRPPQLFDPESESWSDTGDFVFPLRGPLDADHSLLLLTDGRALAVGVNRLQQPAARMTELYDPATGTWSAGTSPSLVRALPEVVYLPDGEVFVGAGDKLFSGGSEPDVLGIVRRCDLLDPLTGAWRRVADMSEFREYHAASILVPDGRVLVAGGTRIKFQVGPTSADVEAYRPPYLFRGVRPRLSDPSATTLARGETVTFDVFPATTLTSAVLMGAQTHTHWVDGGVPRRLVLPVDQSGRTASVALPADPDLLPVGLYMLFGMVDDIPSEALLVFVE